MKCADGFIIVALFFSAFVFDWPRPGRRFYFRRRSQRRTSSKAQSRPDLRWNKQTNKQNNRGTFSSDCPSGFKLGFPTNWFFFFCFGFVFLFFLSDAVKKQNKTKQKNRRNPFPIDRLGQSRIDRRWPEQPIGAQIKRTTRRRSDRGERPTVRFDGGASFFSFCPFFLSCACFCLIDRAVAVGLVADHVTRKWSDQRCDDPTEWSRTRFSLIVSRLDEKANDANNNNNKKTVQSWPFFLQKKGKRGKNRTPKINLKPTVLLKTKPVLKGKFEKKRNKSKQNQRQCNPFSK